MLTAVTITTPQKTVGNFPLLEEGMSHPYNCLVALLDNAILLQVVRRGVVILNTLIHAVRHKFSHREFTVVVGA
jgi:hypothetical protein